MRPSRQQNGSISGRAVAVLVILIGVAGAMAFYRAHTTPREAWLGLTSTFTGSTSSPLPANQVSALTELDHEQETLADRVAPAVVAINVTAHTAPAGRGIGPGEGDGGLPPDNPLSQFFGQFGGQMPRRPQFEQGLGSGIIISPDGYIVTNNHVVQDATEIQVTLLDKRTFRDAKVIGTDALTDLAVIKINATGLPNLPWGDSHVLKQGDNVFAIGNPFQLNFTMTRGIISGKGRINQDRTDARAPGDYLQTDAAINPGNSGGPLVDVRGEVVGVNAFIYTSTGSFSGEAFAIPSEIAKPVSTTLIAKGKVVRGYLGINIEDLTPELAPFFKLPPSATGALVTSTTPGEPGQKAGLREGDVIESLNGNKIDGATQLQLATGAVSPGNPVKLGVMRDGQPVTLTVTLGTAPQDQNQPTASPKAASSGGVELGLNLENITPDTRDQLQLPEGTTGILIESVVPGGPAFIAGLGRGLIITSINRVPVSSVAQAKAQLAKLPPGADVLLQVAVPGPQGGEQFFVVHPAPASGSGR
ncbi:MAG TPA: trypsin-like peptidase domain-containing protein [Terriglobales bacterium]|nr:trypsin-like peptidase domain-containing protein [Terriglobales bacterium]